MVNEVIKVLNGKVQKILVMDFPKGWTSESKQYWLTNHGFTERQAYMMAFNISEAEMKRIEND